ncbi:MAG: SOS response-associated peptidase [Lachnospiraceae bacterium]|nr:SOS response-associated peptidase [Lachnospiraceae bacterium]
MCSRYYLKDELYDRLEELLGSLNEEIHMAGDVYPSENALVMKGSKEQHPVACRMLWGYPGYGGKGLVINARAESVEEKPLFREGIRHRRCIIPASGFYEWDRNKQKITFHLPDAETIFFAGCYDLFGGVDCFTILTTEANSSMQPVHDRMPLILKREEIADWLFTNHYRELLHKTMPELVKECDYEQLSFL